MSDHPLTDAKCEIDIAALEGFEDKSIETCRAKFQNINFSGAPFIPPPEEPEMTQAERRCLIVAVAESWLGTPFRDAQRLKKCGVDCAQFVAAVYEESGLIAHVEIPYYSPQIYLHNRGDDTYIKMLLQYAHEIEEKDVRAGDTVVYRVADSYTHGGIVKSWPDCIIHPIKPHGVVCSGAFEGFVARRKRKFFSFFKVS